MVTRADSANTATGCSWAPMTEDEILLGDIYGKLLLVKLVYRKSSNAEQAITDLHVTDLGDVSSLSLSSFSSSERIRPPP